MRKSHFKKDLEKIPLRINECESADTRREISSSRSRTRGESNGKDSFIEEIPMVQNSRTKQGTISPNTDRWSLSRGSPNNSLETVKNHLVCHDKTV